MEMTSPGSRDRWCREAWLVLACWLTTVLGCGQTTRELGQVEGQVTFQGEAVAKAVVVFHGLAQSLPIMTAPADANGRYRVTMAEGLGLPLGNYQVCVLPASIEFDYDRPTSELPEERANIPSRYRQADTSKLIFQVGPGANQFDIAMTP